jgi:peptide/nickel transport system permease protein
MITLAGAPRPATRAGRADPAHPSKAPSDARPWRIRARALAGPLGKALAVSLLVVVITFVLGKVVLGNPGRQVLGYVASQEAVDQFNAALGLDRPVWDQFVSYLAGLARFDLGVSYAYNGMPVWGLVKAGIATSALLACLTVVCSAALGLALGLAAATARVPGVDFSIRMASLTALSTPAPFVGLLLILVFALTWRILPAGGWPDSFFERLPYLILPVAALSIGLTPILVRIVRERALAELAEPHVEAALARGVSWARVLARHVVPNCSGPLVIVLAMNMGTLLSGAVVVEIVFGIPGLGRVLASAVATCDIPVIQAVALLAGLFVTLCNVMAEIAQRLIDPRLRA